MKLVSGDKKIAKVIVAVRGEHVILDMHLAQMYAVETRVLKQ